LQLDLKEQESLRQYLLGSLPEGEISALEERLFTEADFYEELLVVEDELIDQYLSGEQSPAERERFESHFSQAPERQRKVRFARTLQKYLSNTSESEAREESDQESPEPAIAVDTIVSPVVSPPVNPIIPIPRKRPFFSFLPSNPALNYALAAVLALVVGGASWIAVSRLMNPASREPGQVLAVILTPGLSRSGDRGDTKISIPPGTGTLQLQLEISKTDYTSYRAELLTSERAEIAESAGLKPETTGARKFITVPVSAGKLKRDDYQVKLSGLRSDGNFEDVATYTFRVLN
jgi:hypothetical protein